ncbi:hypothetical protein [Actinoplanes sp. NBRC 103695]|uniref:hypothetical protein n=1 Tax=Actinoplanes sp. NBRC 103695 TaxID=3032202 RepID=UPI002553E3EC|nr:hypothetical protein [Actinoplanes sp. NBRC 103695]
MAEDANRDRDSDKASMVFNGAALVASDCGDAELARTWCHQHANLYLSQAPLNGYTARFALEPVVNLARLRIRAGDGDGAHRLLTDLYQAINDRAPAVIDGLELLPEQLPTEHAQRDQIIDWLSDIMLADGTRALTVAGRWGDALAHVRRYDGLGPTLHEGRQVAVMALTMQGNSATAAALLRDTTIEHSWEQLVRDLLTSWHARTTGAGLPPNQTELLGQSLETLSTPGLAVFRTRLFLAAIDLAPAGPSFLTDNALSQLVSDLLQDQDANAARELLQHHPVSPMHHEKLNQLIDASGLGAGRLPRTAGDPLLYALESAGGVIRDAR